MKGFAVPGTRAREPAARPYRALPSRRPRRARRFAISRMRCSAVLTFYRPALVTTPMRAPLRRALTAVARGASASGMNLPSRRDHRGRARPPSADGPRKRHTAALIDRPTGPALTARKAVRGQAAPLPPAGEPRKSASPGRRSPPIVRRPSQSASIRARQPRGGTA
jgi:hypothetical protein